MSKLIGTAGHVDHGKTSLIRALTGIDADRLPEEKKRGLTIDIGFAHIDLPDVGRVSIVDVPGHERFVANMLVGALGVDVAILCVAADESVKPQTIEHLQILEFLPVEHLIVALTRSDLVDAESQLLTIEEVNELVGTTRFRNVPVVPVSSVTGKGLSELKSALSKCLKDNQSPDICPWYLPIDRVFTVKGHGTVVTGTLMQGVVHEGADAVIHPGGHKCRIRQIQIHDSTVLEADKGQRVALNVTGVKSDAVSRGMTVGYPGAVSTTSELEVDVRWSCPVKHAQRVRVSIGADEVIARLLIGKDGSYKLRTERPVASVIGQPVIIRRYSPPDVLGGGKVLRSTTAAARPLQSVIDHSDLEGSVRNLVSVEPRGVFTDEICKALGRSPQDLGSVFETLVANRIVLGFAGLWFTPETFEDSTSQFLKTLEGFHDSYPERLMFPKEAVAKSSRLGWVGRPLDRIVSELVGAGKVRQNGALIGLVGRAAAINPAQRQMLDRVIQVLDSSGINVPTVPDLAKSLRVPQQAVDGVLRLGADAGETVYIGDGLWYSRRALDDIAKRAEREFGNRPFTASDFRTVLGTSRKFAIPILEHFDALRLTFRQGDNRVFN